MEHRYRTVLFDLDGTLADTSPGILRSVRHAEKEMGFAPLPEEELDQVIGPPLAQSFPQMYGIDPETTQRMIQVYRAFYWEEGVLDIRVFDGMRELLDALQERKVHLGVATMKLRPYAEKTLSHAGLLEYFSTISSFADGEESTKARLIRRAMADLGENDPSRVLMVGDSVFDSQGAAEAGVDFAAVTCGFGLSDPEALARYPYVVAAGDIHQLADWLLPRVKAGE